jgi:rhomboid protease GluP
MPSRAPWLRPDLFPTVEDPAGPWGAIGGEKTTGAVPDPASLRGLVRADDQREIAFVWTPAAPVLTTVFEADEVADAVLERDRIHWRSRTPPAWRSLILFLGVLAAGGIASILEPTLVRIFALLMLIILVELWSKGPDVLLRARSSIRLIEADPDRYRRGQNASARYGHWSSLRRPWGTWILTAILALLFLLQYRVGLRSSIEAAGLMKDQVRAGEVWRMLTAGLIHGGVAHIIFNGMALIAIGRMVEALLGPWRMLTGFVIAVLVGSLASLILMPNTPSVGASGGILGLGGVLIGLSWRRAEIREAGLARAMARWLLVLAMIGLVGWGFIDNAAHGGGVVGGILVGWLVAPRTAGAYPAPFTWPGRCTHALAALTLLAGVGAVAIILS